MTDVWIGWAGLVLLVVSWTPGALDTWKKGRTGEKPAFLMTYALATLLLLVYSIQLGDAPFTLLNGLALLLVCVQLYFLFWPRGGSKRQARKR
ncbi:MAG: hypothetical protein KGH63_03090 [Candidatus Micrarchaeota archaeon]|nr:hypothetical protein [Candidatus Micrarchaeota archaeon]